MSFGTPNGLLEPPSHSINTSSPWLSFQQSVQHPKQQFQLWEELRLIYGCYGCHITLIALYWLSFCARMRACVVAVSATKFHKAFHSCLPFLSSCNTSLHHSFQTPPLLVSQLFDWHAAAYFSQLCLLCPVVLRTLFLFHVSIFRMAQWCIYLLSLTSLTSYRFLFIHSYTTVRAYKITLFCMCRSWMHMIWMIDYDFKRIAVHLADKQMAVQLFPSWVVVKYLQVMTHLSMRNLRSNNNIPQNLLFSEKNNFRKAVCTPVSMSQIQLNKILAKNWIVLKWSTGTCHCPHDDSCLPERKIWV